ncbi:MAG: hypothetical protein JWM99_1426 [Verrucomicrobiales bacterium]|nr:hypothetical protein [Verrucomicrobiales bacterium]
MIQLKPNSIDVAMFLAGTNAVRVTNNQPIGPIRILLRTEKEVIFTQPIEKGKTNQFRAQMLSADLVQAIVFQ